MDNLEYLRQSLLHRVQKRVDSLGSGGLKGKISDGYHTFDELYDHRIENFITICRLLAYHPNKRTLEKPVWKSKTHSDGSVWDGWFILGIGYMAGDQITYHLPMSRWEDCWFANTLEKAPDWDGHTPADVLKRLKTI